MTIILRAITGTVRRSNGDAWSTARVSLSLVSSIVADADSESVYPRQTQIATCNDAGELPTGDTQLKVIAGYTYKLTLPDNVSGNFVAPSVDAGLTIEEVVALIVGGEAEDTEGYAGVTVAQLAYLEGLITAVPDASDLITHAPSDGTQYASQDGTWEALVNNSGASDVDDLTTTTGTATHMMRVAATGGLEYRTAAQVRGDIGAEAAGLMVPLAGGTMTGALVLSGEPTTNLHAATKKYVDDNAGGGAGDFMADGSVLMTGPLGLDPGADDSAVVMRIPITSADVPDFEMRIGKTVFNGVDDITSSAGWGAGSIGAGSVSWFPQIEFSYNNNGENWVEWHLNLSPIGSGGVIRPVEYKFNHDGDAGSIFSRASTIQYLDMSATNALVACTLGATPATSRYAINGEFWPNIPNADPNALYIRDQSGNLYEKIDTQLDWVEFRSQFFILQNRANVSKFQYAYDRFTFFGESTNSAGINVQEPSNARGIFLRAPSSNVKEHIVLTNNAGDTEFAIGIGGKIQTNQISAATTLGAVVGRKPIYNGSGTLVGYEAIYDNIT